MDPGSLTSRPCAAAGTWHPLSHPPTQVPSYLRPRCPCDARTHDRHPGVRPHCLADRRAVKRRLAVPTRGSVAHAHSAWDASSLQLWWPGVVAAWRGRLMAPAGRTVAWGACHVFMGVWMWRGGAAASPWSQGQGCNPGGWPAVTWRFPQATPPLLGICTLCAARRQAKGGAALHVAPWLLLRPGPMVAVRAHAALDLAGTAAAVACPHSSLVAGHAR